MCSLHNFARRSNNNTNPLFDSVWRNNLKVGAWYNSIYYKFDFYKYFAFICHVKLTSINIFARLK